MAVTATIFVKPGHDPIDQQYGLIFSDGLVLQGFATAWHAWAFCICNGMDDPMPDTPDNKLCQLRPPIVKPVQTRMRI